MWEKVKAILIASGIIAIICFIFIAVLCEPITTVDIKVKETEDIHCDVMGLEALEKIGNGLYYDTATRIVYWWNGMGKWNGERGIAPTPYYAPNGLPYKYNPQTEEFEQIK